MDGFLRLVGALAVLLWGLGGAAAWLLAGEGVQVVLGDADASAGTAEDVRLLEDSVDGLRTDLRALTEALETNFSRLVDASEGDRTRLREILDELDEAATAHVVAARLETAAERALARLGEFEQRTRSRGNAPADRPVVVQPPEGATAEAVGPPPSTAKAGHERTADRKVEAPGDTVSRSFLSFRLPSDGFSADAMRSWSLLPELSRVGFDGTSTLHDFSAATTAVRGDFRVNPARPEEGIEGRVHVTLTALDSGSADRDAAIREHLAVEAFPEATFELQGYEPDSEAGGAGRGVVTGRMSVHGVTREFSMPVRFELDDAHRMSLRGEAPLLLSDHDVRVPDKLGLIHVDDEVRVWISLRARPAPRVAH